MAEAGDTGAPLVCMWWGRYEVPQLAGFLSEDLEAGWGHAVAWSGTAELADTYRARLQGVRDGLAAVWPPERSAAAAVYLGRLDSMIASLADVNETASVNYRALGGVLDALQGARAKIYELDDRYQKADAAARAVLNQQAQQHMSEADDVVVSHYGQLTSPKPYDPTRRVDPPAVEVDAGSDGGAARTPRTSGSDGMRSPSVSERYSGTPSGGGAQVGGSPVLASTPAALDVGSSGLRAGAPAPGGLPDAGPGVGAGSWMVNTPQGRVLRAGAVIGMPSGEPASPVPRWSGAVPEGGGPARPARAGSGSAAGLAGEPGEAASKGQGFLGGMGAGAGARSGQRRVRRSEPYVQWEAPTGVPPVIEPPPERPHDPGPGVIGIDR